MHRSSRHGKFLFLAFCLVALTLPHLSEEFGLFGGGDKSDGDERKKAPKNVGEKKHQFHKLKKVNLADYEPDDNAEDDENDVGGNNDDGDDEDQDDDNDSENEENNDEDKSEEKSKKKKSQSIFKMILDEEEREEAEESKRESDDDSGGFFSFSWIKIWSSEEKEEKDSNGIINWLKSWRSTSSSDDDGNDESPAPKSEGSGWVGYLNRWPFNVLVPFGKTKKIRLPKCDGPPADTGAEPLSQEHFESLLHTMPGFVLNVAKVTDPECRQQLKVFHHQLRGNKLWPIQSKNSNFHVVIFISLLCFQ